MMNPRARLVAFAFLAGAVIPSCGVNVMVHDPTAAATAASDFARVAFVAKDAARAHALLEPAFRDDVSADQLAEVLGKMHPVGHPEKVEAIEYEPLPGRRAMNIFLRGSGAQEDFYYRLLMEGDQGKGYRVAGLWRGTGPYPSALRKPLSGG